MKRWQSTIELALLLVAVLAPQFILANEVNGDEFAKATSGVAMAGVVVAAFKVWKTKAAKRAERKEQESQSEGSEEQQPQ